MLARLKPFLRVWLLTNPPTGTHPPTEQWLPYDLTGWCPTTTRHLAPLPYEALSCSSSWDRTASALWFLTPYRNDAQTRDW